MNTETYLKLAALAAILIIALVYPVVSALVLTAAAAWHLQDFKISETALVQKVVRLAQMTPSGLQALIVSSTTGLKARIVSSTTGLLASPAPAKLALPAPDAVPKAQTAVREPVMNQRSGLGWWLRASEGRLARRLR